MTLGSPPARGVLRRLASWRLAGRELHRVHRASRPLWWFASTDPAHPEHGGRFDLSAPNGSCYVATTAAAAVLEALQHDFAGGLLPASALRRRALSTVSAPAGAPPAAHLTSRRAAAAGVTVGLWSDPDRSLTRRWAAELHGAGWQALHHGAQHDPTGAGRSVTLFDRAGEHVPWGDVWPDPDTQPLVTPTTTALLGRHGITVTGDRPDLDPVDLPPDGWLPT